MRKKGEMGEYFGTVYRFPIGPDLAEKNRECHRTKDGGKNAGGDGARTVV